MHSFLASALLVATIIAVLVFLIFSNAVLSSYRSIVRHGARVTGEPAYGLHLRQTVASVQTPEGAALSRRMRRFVFWTAIWLLAAIAFASLTIFVEDPSGFAQMLEKFRNFGP
jgi:hypothetical protein